MPAEDFNPHSPNAMFSRILEKLEQQDRTSKANHGELTARIDSFDSGLRLTTGRVGELEKSQWKQRGFVAAIALGIPLLWQLITGKPTS